MTAEHPSHSVCADSQHMPSTCTRTPCASSHMCKGTSERTSERMSHLSLQVQRWQHPRHAGRAGGHAPCEPRGQPGPLGLHTPPAGPGACGSDSGTCGTSTACFSCSFWAVSWGRASGCGRASHGTWTDGTAGGNAGCTIGWRRGSTCRRYVWHGCSTAAPSRQRGLDKDRR